MLSAKEQILAQIRAAGAESDLKLVRSPLVASIRSREEVVEQFAEYAAEYRANVIRVKTVDVLAAISKALQERGSQRVVIANDLEPQLRPTNVSVSEDLDYDNLRLDEFDSVVTTCAVAVAETGTIVLDGGPGQGKRAITLIPDHHICIVYESQVVESVPEAVAAVAEAIREGRPLTWISGPSATSDIELNRVEGVHGPRILDIMLIG